MQLTRETNRNKIKKLNLDYVIEQMLVDRHETGWSLYDLLRIEKLYKKFLMQKLANPKSNSGHSVEVDAFWRQHILNTEKYTKDCQGIFGKFVHYTPIVKKEGLADLMGLKAKILNTFGTLQQACYS